MLGGGVKALRRDSVEKRKKEVIKRLTITSLAVYFKFASKEIIERLAG